MKDNLERKEYVLSTFKGLIGAIPFAGTFLNEVAFEARSRIKQERVNGFIEEFSEYMNIHSESEADFSSLNVEKIGDIFEEIIISVSKTSAHHKIEVFKKILYKQLKPSKNETDEVLRFINITNDISGIQFKILSTFDSLSDNVLKYRIQILELEDEGKRIPNEIKNLQEKNNTKQISPLKERLDKLPKLICKKKNALQRGKVNPNSHRTFNIERNVYITEVQDLIAKGLLFDFAIRTSLINPYEAFGITKLGRSYLTYIKDV